MKVLFLNPSFKRSRAIFFEQYLVRSGSRWPHTGFKLKYLRPHYLPFPFFLATAAAVLKKNGHAAVGLDAVALDLNLDEMLERISRINAQVIVFEPTAASLDFDLELCGLIKKKCSAQTATVLCGAFASRAGERFLSACPFVDFVVKGEYETAVLELIDFIADGSGAVPSGLFYRNADKIVFSGAREPLKEINDLPFAGREFFPSGESFTNESDYYWDGFCRRHPAVQIYASRGCLFSCAFCLWKNSLFAKTGFRAMSAKATVAHIKELCKIAGAREVYFDDDDFTADPERVRELCQELIAQKTEVEWSCMGSVARIDRELIAFMARAGCRGIKFGVESADPAVLARLGKAVDPEHVSRVAVWCAELGIRTHAAFVLGLEGESEESLALTHKYIVELDVDSVQVSIAAPVPDCDELFGRVCKNNTLEDSVLRQYDGKTGSRKSLLLRRRKIMRGWLLCRIFTKRFWKNINAARRGNGTGFFLKQGFCVFIDEMYNS